MANPNERWVGGRHYQETAAFCPNCGATVQHWDWAGRIPYLEGQITKYLSRWQAKGGLTDLHKAQHFMEKLLEWAKQDEQRQKTRAAQIGA